MHPTRTALSAAVFTAAILSVACGSPATAIPARIYADNEQAAVAMRTAPLILLIRIVGVRMTGDERTVAKPPQVGGPNTPTIPLHLAWINADVLLAVHGQARSSVEFYSWIWASGTHGGPRLFHPHPGGMRVVFLRDEGGYLHTVGDYPSHDLELHAAWGPALLSAWKSGQMSGAEPLYRLVALRLRAELEGLTETELREDFGDEGPRVNHYWGSDLYELIRLVGPFFIVSQLDDLCLHSRNPATRFASCFVTAQYFPGRCKAYPLARNVTSDGFGEALLARRFTSCHVGEPYGIRGLRSGGELRSDFYGASFARQHRRETLRVYTTAMDTRVHNTACEIAAATPEGRDLPECAGSRE